MPKRKKQTLTSPGSDSPDDEHGVQSEVEVERDLDTDASLLKALKEYVGIFENQLGSSTHNWTP